MKYQVWASAQINTNCHLTLQLDLWLKYFCTDEKIFIMKAQLQSSVSCFHAQMSGTEEEEISF